MECLQTVSKLNNTEADCPAKAGRCELMFDSENVCMLLRLSLITPDPKPSAMYADVCCYDRDGCILTVMERVPYIDGGMLLELSSLMTVAVRIILRTAEYENGDTWQSELEFQKRIDLNSDEKQNFDDTVKFSPNEAAKIISEQTDGIEAEKPPKKLSRAERRAARRERNEAEEEIRRIIKHDPHERRKRIAGRLLCILIIAGLCVGCVYAVQYKRDADAAYQKAMNLYNSGRFEEAVPELENAEKYKFFGDAKNELDWSLAIGYARQRNFHSAAVLFKNLNGYKESRANYRSIIEAYSGIISAGGEHTLGLRSSGIVVAAGDNTNGQCEVSEWSDIIAVAAGGGHSVGLRRDGTVAAVGDNSNEQCMVDAWSNIIDIAAGANHTAAVLNVGRVVAAGDNSCGQCDVGEWSGVVAVAAGAEHTVGLKIDGTVVAAGNNSHGECSVSEWTDIVQVAAGKDFTVGLKYDGSIVAAGKNLGIEEAEKPQSVIMIAAGDYNLLMTTADGRTVAIGGNDSSQGATTLWTDVVAADGGTRHSVAARADGTVFGCGDNGSGQTLLSEWVGLGIPKSTVTIRKGE